ncbi:MAG: DUF452 family protein [Candidatus Gastranaerophilales bacterium]|nr:DUF452 family protein [Candidatus Gastranaerophilales bacterium]
MQYFWLNKKDENKKLILFFNGWAMNETPVQHLKNDDFDVLVLFDYRDVDFNLAQFNFSKYDEKYLVCWSMGVYVANLFKKDLFDFDKKIAINGTTSIIDDNFGIPEKIYKITVKLMNEDSCDKFIKNMFDNGKLNPNITITRSLAELKEELISIQKIELKEELAFDKAIISELDRIVPTKNQLNFWQNKTKIEKINSTHCPFEIYSKWTDLIC